MTTLRRAMTDKQAFERNVCVFVLNTLESCRHLLELAATDREIKAGSIFRSTVFEPGGVTESISDAEHLLRRTIAQFDELYKKKEKE